VFTHAPARASVVDWPEGEPFEDVERGTLKSGKEAEIFLVERRFERSGPRLLAHKRYRIRYPGKDQLRAEGFSNATSFRRDAAYRTGWNVDARSRRALASGNKSRHGQELAAKLWPVQEWAMLRRASAAGVSVPHPVEQTADGILMEYIGDEGRAAPKLAQAKLDADALASAWRQLLTNLRLLTGEGLVHADLSAYNLLWWEGRLVLIDLPQIVDLVGNPTGLDFLLRDCTNVCTWFRARGLDVDEHDLFGELLAHAF